MGPQIGYLWFENVEVFVDIIIVNFFFSNFKLIRTKHMNITLDEDKIPSLKS